MIKQIAAIPAAVRAEGQSAKRGDVMRRAAVVLFYLVFGTMDRFVALRRGPDVAGIALGVVLAWSIAASTPVYSALI